MFTDAYIHKEDNAKIFDVIISFLTLETFKLNAIDAQDPEIETYFQIPDISTLANNLKACLQESDEIPRNLDAVFDQKLFAMDTSMVPKALACVLILINTSFNLALNARTNICGRIYCFNVMWIFFNYFAYCICVIEPTRNYE